MNISYSEAGDYFRGLLLLIRKDHKIIEEEKTLLMHFGKSLGFASTFCAGAVSEIIENKYISDSPPVFSSMQVAKSFIKDGFIIAYCDNELHPNEEQWLRSVAQQNGINENWFHRIKKKMYIRSTVMI
jgi:hypothetical protein